MAVRWPLANSDQVRQFVAATGVRCPRCRYSLAGLRGDVCPECGTVLSVDLLSRPRGMGAVRAAVIGGPTSARSALRVLAGLNVLMAAAVMISAAMHHGAMPVLSWLAPGVLGAFVFSIQYLAVFARYCPAREDPIEGWGEGTAGFLLLAQTAGLVLIWL